MKVPIEKIKEITPDMTCKQIREKIKEYKKTAVSTPQTGQKPETNVNDNKIELPVEKDNEIRCENCGKSYFINENETTNKWIEIMGKYVAPCCYIIHDDSELLRKKERRGNNASL